ncbi:MAG: type III-B CRISPR-associated protein Cas10/Cmr2 [Anaerolineae bacterium]|nr:type III-B CRISPR-associated protein Cas10/Cmr2 [Candidatus Roseilinea sp.]MDW8448715.1 type III-B CRISPR-associated protein Cas10/Cmr2 [Anaerolineae bacterium]
MTPAVLIFTFSPVQSFITEARRAADLYVGSKILSQLAKAAAQSIEQQGGDLVYPASPDGDAPNVIVARVPAENAKQIAQAARQALIDEWRRIGKTAQDRLTRWGVTDDTFNAIWERQMGHVWEVFWVAAEERPDYRHAYERARDALDAVKRSRLFAACDEPGVKDTLSGQREALHWQVETTYRAVKAYWKQIGQKAGPSKLRPEGRERLDAIGATKRFCDIADRQFPSTSTIAALDFIERVKQEAPSELRAYCAAVAKLGPYRVRNDGDWPFDGDLLYKETLTAERLKDSYGLDRPDAQALAEARRALEALHRAAGGSPSPYYALLILDGDGMGGRIGQCLKQGTPADAHAELSRSLGQFAAQVKVIVPADCLIYNGGDDVLAFLPLSWALDKAQELAEEFEKIANSSSPTPGTASVGIALVHHLHPLDAALRAARDAERAAKRVKGKAALCVTALKRSGEQERAVTKRSSINVLRELIAHLQQGHLSARFVSDAVLTLRAIPDDRPEMLEAELRRQARRHSSEAWRRSGAPDGFAQQLAAWAAQPPAGVENLRRWLGIARFIVRESQEVDA